MRLKQLEATSGTAGQITVVCKATGKRAIWNEAAIDGWVADLDGEAFVDYYSPEAVEQITLIESVDSGEYDTEAMLIDLRNRNFSTDRVEEYWHENIVRESLTNGQFSQARQQCASFGLNYEVELAQFKQETR